MNLNPEEIERYDRQIRVFGINGQKKLKNSSVLVVGAGGLGSAVLYYLAAAGVGKIIVVDPENVELSNLNRQIIHFTHDIGKEKVVSAKEKLKALNPHVEVIGIKKYFDEKLGDEVVPQVDVVVDALDNWDTRIVLNKICVKYRKPLVHAGVREAYGQLLVIMPGKGPCLQCVFPSKIKEERPFPILGPTPGILGAMEALEVIKIITGYGEPLVGRLLLFDGKNNVFTEIKVKRNPKCPVCGHIKEQ
ncbi:HesA/MoeB/ThiF family protein [Desulfurococcaceae archaeon MEX13E-LK6-19]|nr:HesA/MoeB/ThiF family protein [Desulfurococcaceae archaeon MEX13E-LK6-19]